MAQVPEWLPGGRLAWPAQGRGEEGPRNCQPSGHREQHTGSVGPKVPRLAQGGCRVSILP